MTSSAVVTYPHCVPFLSLSSMILSQRRRILIIQYILYREYLILYKIKFDDLANLFHFPTKYDRIQGRVQHYHNSCYVYSCLIPNVRVWSYQSKPSQRYLEGTVTQQGNDVYIQNFDGWVSFWAMEVILIWVATSDWLWVLAAWWRATENSLM